MKHDQSGVIVMNPQELQVALDSKVDRKVISHDYSTATYNIVDIEQAETTNNGRWLVASTKAVLSLYIHTQEQKLSFYMLRNVYKGSTPAATQPYLQSGNLSDGQLPFSVQGAKALYAELNTRKVNFADATATFNYYNGTSHNPPTDRPDEKYLNQNGAVTLFKTLYEDKIPYITISNTYTDGAATEAAVVESTIKDPLRNVQLRKIASELSVRKLYVNVRNRINNEVAALVNKINTDINAVWNFINFKEKIVDLTNSDLIENNMYLLIPLDEIEPYSSYELMFFFDTQKGGSIEIFKVLFCKTTSAFYCKIFNLERHDNKSKGAHIEVIYDDTIGVCYKLHGFISPSLQKFGVKIKTELKNGDFK